MINVIGWRQNQQGAGNRGVCFDISAFVYNLFRFLPNSPNRVAENHRVSRAPKGTSSHGWGRKDRPTGRQKPAGQEEEAAAARFLGPLQLAQLPDLPTLRVSTYHHLPYYLTPSYMCVYVLYFGRFSRCEYDAYCRRVANETHIYTRLNPDTFL